MSADCSVMKSALVHLVVPGFADRRGDQLHVALEQLRRAVDHHVVAVFEAAVVLLAGVPQPRGDRPAAVRELDLQVEVAVAIGAQLFIGGEKDLVDLLVVAKLADKASFGGGGHERSRESRVKEARGLAPRDRRKVQPAIVGQPGQATTRPRCRIWSAIFHATRFA